MRRTEQGFVTLYCIVWGQNIPQSNHLFVILLRARIRVIGIWETVEIKKKKKKNQSCSTIFPTPPLLWSSTQSQELHLSQPKLQEGIGMWYFGTATNKRQNKENLPKIFVQNQLPSYCLASNQKCGIMRLSH